MSRTRAQGVVKMWKDEKGFGEPIRLVGALLARLRRD